MSNPFRLCICPAKLTDAGSQNIRGLLTAETDLKVAVMAHALVGTGRRHDTLHRELLFRLCLQQEA